MLDQTFVIDAEKQPDQDSQYLHWIRRVDHTFQQRLEFAELLLDSDTGSGDLHGNGVPFERSGVDCDVRTQTCENQEVTSSALTGGQPFGDPSRDATRIVFSRTPIRSSFRSDGVPKDPVRLIVLGRPCVERLERSLLRRSLRRKEPLLLEQLVHEIPNGRA